MAEKQTCAESVYHSEGNWGRSAPCKRKAGFGPEGKYCKQHAERFTQGETVTWYRASCLSEYSLDITTVEVVKETETALLLKTGTGATREKKESKWYCYFRTRAEAVGFYRKRIAGIRAIADKLEAQLEGKK